MRHIFAILLTVLISLHAQAHGDHHHRESARPLSSGESLPEKKVPAIPQVADILAQINREYQIQVKRIFQSKCMDCHSRFTHYPWYYKWPIIHGYIDSDVNEARQHLDFSNDFPFQGHGSVTEDLQAIIEDTQENEMPPLLYRLAHGGTTLTENDKKTIISWAEMAQNLLQKSGLK